MADVATVFGWSEASLYRMDIVDLKDWRERAAKRVKAKARA